MLTFTDYIFGNYLIDRLILFLAVEILAIVGIRASITLEIVCPWYINLFFFLIPIEKNIPIAGYFVQLIGHLTFFIWLITKYILKTNSILAIELRLNCIYFVAFAIFILIMFFDSLLTK